MSSTITIDDSDEEVIDLDTSQDISDVSNNHNELSINAKGAISENMNDCETPTSRIVYECANQPRKPLFKVIFRDQSVSRQYRRQIKNFLEELISLKDKGQEDDENSCNLSLEIWNSDADSSSQLIDVATESDDSQNIVSDMLFTIDTQPQLHNDLDVPTYGKKYKNVFEKTNAETVADTKEECAPKLTCFNCMENHSLRDCPNPRNQAVINKNRKNFNMKGNIRTVRYHLDNDQKFGHMTPGQLSNNLRKALGLKGNELPAHIYRMRILGYPPGWLEEARLQHSGISLFNSDGIADHDDRTDEPGELFETTDRDQYDVKKIYDFPGFNVPPPPGTRDNCGQYWTSHIQALHSKQTMLLNLSGKKADDGYKRKKLKLSNTISKDSPVPISTEMEIDNLEDTEIECAPGTERFVPPLPHETREKLSERPLESSIEDSECRSQETSQLPESPNNSTPSSRTNSPSLFDLENMKKRLLVELQDSNSQPNSDSLSKGGSLNSTVKSDMPPPSNDATPTRSTLNTSRGSVKSVDFGTPVLQSTSPYNKLPSSDKFSKNICDVINFENLPDSTGKYEQMTGVLQKVRHELSKLNQE